LTLYAPGGAHFRLEGRSSFLYNDEKKEVELRAFISEEIEEENRKIDEEVAAQARGEVVETPPRTMVTWAQYGLTGQDSQATNTSSACCGSAA